jgi:hypothetical protein
MALIKDKLKVTGRLSIKHIGKDGNVIREYKYNNLVVTTGLQFIAARLADSGSPDQMSHMAVGTSSTAPALTDTQLGTEIGRSALTVAGGVPSGTEITYTCTIPSGVGTGAITEAGIFNGDGTPSGTMLCRTTFLTVNKGLDDTLAVSWVITIS